MKDNNIIKQYSTEPIPGTMQLKDLKSFFGTAMIDIEDNIIIDNTTIIYNQVSGDTSIGGFQYYNNTSMIAYETIYSSNLVDLKVLYHTMILDMQDDVSSRTNTKWRLTIDIKNLLRDYLHYRIKEARSFKGVKPEMVNSNDINVAVYDYIDNNIMNRYKFNNINLYIKYKEIMKDSDIYNSSILQYNPTFNSSIENSDNLVQNVGVYSSDINYLNTLTVNYSQIKSSENYTIDYYFDIEYVKI